MLDNHLQKFCSEILLALEGKVAPHWFNDGFALCANARFYDEAHWTFVSEKLHILFKGESFPFNSYPFEYRYERRTEGGLYANKKRLAFLKKHAKGA